MKTSPKDRLLSPHEIADLTNWRHPLKRDRHRSLSIAEINEIAPSVTQQNIFSYLACQSRLEARIRESLASSPYKRMDKTIKSYGYDMAWQIARIMAYGHMDPEYAAKHVNVNEIPESMVRISNSLCTLQAMMQFISYLDDNGMPLPHVWKDAYLTGKSVVNITNASKISGHIKGLFARDMLCYALQCDCWQAEHIKNLLWEYSRCFDCIDTDGKHRKKPEPTQHLPGSPEKVFLMAARYLNGEELFCDEDALPESAVAVRAEALQCIHQG